MPRPTFPPDPWVGLLLRRLTVVAASVWIVTRIGGALARSSPDGPGIPDVPPPADTAPTLPVGLRPASPPGPGLLLPPFEVDDVEHGVSGWVLLDRGAGQVMTLDPTGAPGQRRGRRGEGPGELSRPRAVALAPDGSVGVLDASGQRLDVFPSDGPPQRVGLDGTECNGTFGDDLVHHGGEWWGVRRCFDGPNADLEVLRIPTTGVPERVERRVLTRMNTDPHLVPLLVEIDGRLYAGSNRDPCLREVGGTARHCLPRPPRTPIPDTASGRMFEELARRARAVGLELSIPTHYPGVVEARSRPSGPVVRIIRPDGSDAWAVAVDDTLRVVAPEGGARAEPGRQGWLLLRDDATGLRVWTLPEPEPDSTPETEADPQAGGSGGQALESS